MKFPADAVAALMPAPPPPVPPPAPVLGVCLSGGGSRALSAALGALSGLRSLPDPDDASRTVIDRVAHLSSVSGGSWASVAFTYLPDEISDDEFLITPVEPADLVKGGAANASNVEHLDPHSLGTAPQQFSPVPIVRVLLKYYRWGLFKRPVRWRWFWTGAIGELILKPFGLYDAKYPRRSDVNVPTKFFSSTPAYVEAEIQRSNPDLETDRFHYVRTGRPSLVVNFNLLENVHEADPVQAPVQATPIDTGILGRWPGSDTVGGGSVQSFGFASTLEGAGSAPLTAKISLDRRYCLADIAGCSSAFFAEQILEFLNKETDGIESAVESELRRFHVPKFICTWIRRWVMKRFEPILDADASDLIPHYLYWPLGEVDAAKPVTKEYGFSDGGSFDDTGVLGMLARTDANRIIAFVNGAAPLTKDPTTQQIIVDGQVPTLFGRHFDAAIGEYVGYGDSPRRFAQVFSDADGEFDAMRNGLWDASTGGGGDDAVGTHTVGFKQELTTIANDVAHIEAGRRVTVLWVVNNRVNAWQEAITDPGIRADLTAGQAAQEASGAPKRDGAKPSGPLENFPLYTTGPQIYLHPEGVNMLAQLTAWNTRQFADEITDMLRS